MHTGIVLDFLPPVSGAFGNNADRLRDVHNTHTAVIADDKLHIVRTDNILLSVVAADDRTVVNTRHTTLKSLLADEAVVAVLANIGNPEHTRVKRSVALCEVADAG